MSASLEGYVVVLALHLLSDIQGFIRALLAMGLEPGKTVVVNIPYSTKASTVAALWTSGIRQLYLSTEYPLDEAVAQAVLRAGDIADRTDSRILVVEDGGYIGPYLHAQHPALLPRVKGIVEQTKNGIWQYEDRGIDPRVPIVSVAESGLKNSLESPLIGRAILRNIEELIGRLGYGLGSLSTLLLGYGATGSQAAVHLASSVGNLRVFDADEEKRDAARKAGLDVVDDLEEACRDVDLLVGCTGRESIGSDALLRLTGHTYFANGSSKRRELDWEAVRSLDAGAERLMGGVATRIELRSGATVTILADGYPVNFVGESVPDEEIAFVYGLLLRSLVLVAATDLDVGFADVPNEIQQEVAADHFRILGREPPS